MNFQNTILEITAGRPDQFPRSTLAQIALSGRSNVGKSSLLNRLLGFKKLARVSSEPGKTITVNFYRVDNRFYLVDLPGYGFARRSPEEQRRFAQLADRYFQENDAIKLVLQLIDLKVGPTADDLTMIDFLRRSGIPFAVAATKCDKPNKTDRAAKLDALPRRAALTDEIPLVCCSAKSGEGIDALRGLISRAATLG